uniref:Uncharacterized protein n=1 Tax=Zonotrichia albicollis TaxID=44394 RepID=A0A8D2QKI5_ZONAL
PPCRLGPRGTPGAVAAAQPELLIAALRSLNAPQGAAGQPQGQRSSPGPPQPGCHICPVSPRPRVTFSGCHLCRVSPLPDVASARCPRQLPRLWGAALPRWDMLEAPDPSPHSREGRGSPGSANSSRKCQESPAGSLRASHL